jgi:hypothetical protein
MPASTFGPNVDGPERQPMLSCTFDEDPSIADVGVCTELAMGLEPRFRKCTI